MVRLAGRQSLSHDKPEPVAHSPHAFTGRNAGLRLSTTKLG